MTLGRTSSGAIKIKTDGGLRAVNCACCGTCPCPLPNEIKGKKIAVTSVSWSSIVEYSIMDACGNFYANTSDGYSISFQYLCPVNPYDWPWMGNIYNGGPMADGSPCNKLSTFILSINPVGIQDVYDDYGCGNPSNYPDYNSETNTSAMYDACVINSATCYGWTLTISEVP